MKLTLHRATLLILLAASATVLTAAPRFLNGPALAPRPQHRDIIIRERRGNQVTSSNWSGYVVTGANDSVTDATGSWLVPSLNCGSTPNAYAAFWVGIDGWGSNTVEQVGTESDCVNGQPSHYAWFEFYPHNYFTIDSVPIKSGDKISAAVQYAGGKFTVSLTDGSTTEHFSTSSKLNQARRSSAEWIVEAPYSGGVPPLADFNNAGFGVDNTGIISTNNASIAGATGPIGSFNPADVLAITMTADNGATKALPSALSTDKTSFTDMWFNPGP
jgi:hypothetical protein